MTNAQFNRTRFAKIMSFDAYEHLEAVTREIRTVRYEMPMVKFFNQKRPSRLLTACIIKYVKAKGGVAKENVQGALRKQNGKWKFEYTGGQPGEEDISVYLNGKYYAIEIKYGKDRQSEAQKRYQKRIETAGFTYKICKTFDDFLAVVGEVL